MTVSITNSWYPCQNLSVTFTLFNKLSLKPSFISAPPILLEDPDIFAPSVQLSAPQNTRRACTSHSLTGHRYCICSAFFHRSAGPLSVLHPYAECIATDLHKKIPRYSVRADISCTHAASRSYLFSLNLLIVFIISLPGEEHCI